MPINDPAPRRCTQRILRDDVTILSEYLLGNINSKLKFQEVAKALVILENPHEAYAAPQNVRVRVHTTRIIISSFDESREFLRVLDREHGAKQCISVAMEVVNGLFS